MSQLSQARESRIMMLRIANDFFVNGVNILNILLPEGNPMAQTQNLRTWQIPTPVVNISFAIEVALKALVVNSPRGKKGHELHHLYSLLSSEFQSKIEKHFETCKTYSYAFIDLVITKHNSPEFPPGGTIKEIIEGTMLRCKDAFVDFRYMYEPLKAYLYFDSNVFIRIAHACIFVLSDDLNIPFEELSQPIKRQTNIH